MRSDLDFAPHYHAAVGFDRVCDMPGDAANLGAGFPLPEEGAADPHRLRHDRSHYRAVSGGR